MEINDKQASMIHGILSSESDSDFDGKELDEIYFSLRPPPLDYDSIKDKIVKSTAANVQVRMEIGSTSNPPKKKAKKQPKADKKLPSYAGVCKMKKKPIPEPKKKAIIKPEKKLITEPKKKSVTEKKRSNRILLYNSETLKKLEETLRSLDKKNVWHYGMSNDVIQRELHSIRVQEQSICENAYKNKLQAMDETENTASALTASEEFATNAFYNPNDGDTESTATNKTVKKKKKKQKKAVEESANVIDIITGTSNDLSTFSASNNEMVPLENTETTFDQGFVNLINSIDCIDGETITNLGTFDFEQLYRAYEALVLKSDIYENIERVSARNEISLNRRTVPIMWDCSNTPFNLYFNLTQTNDSGNFEETNHDDSFVKDATDSRVLELQENEASSLRVNEASTHGNDTFSEVPSWNVNVSYETEYPCLGGVSFVEHQPPIVTNWGKLFKKTQNEKENAIPEPSLSITEVTEDISVTENREIEMEKTEETKDDHREMSYETVIVTDSLNITKVALEDISETENHEIEMEKTKETNDGHQEREMSFERLIITDIGRELLTYFSSDIRTSENVESRSALATSTKTKKRRKKAKQVPQIAGMEVIETDEMLKMVSLDAIETNEENTSNSTVNYLASDIKPRSSFNIALPILEYDQKADIPAANKKPKKKKAKQIQDLQNAIALDESTKTEDFVKVTREKEDTPQSSNTDIKVVDTQSQLTYNYVPVKAMEKQIGDDRKEEITKEKSLNIPGNIERRADKEDFKSICEVKAGIQAKENVIPEMTKKRWKSILLVNREVKDDIIEASNPLKMQSPDAVATFEGKEANEGQPRNPNTNPAVIDINQEWSLNDSAANGLEGAEKVDTPAVRKRSKRQEKKLKKIQALQSTVVLDEPNGGREDPLKIVQGEDREKHGCKVGRTDDKVEVRYTVQGNIEPRAHNEEPGTSTETVIGLDKKITTRKSKAKKKKLKQSVEEMPCPVPLEEPARWHDFVTFMEELDQDKSNGTEIIKNEVDWVKPNLQILSEQSGDIVTDWWYVNTTNVSADLKLNSEDTKMTKKRKHIKKKKVEQISKEKGDDIHGTGQRIGLKNVGIQNIKKLQKNLMAVPKEEEEATKNNLYSNIPEESTGGFNNSCTGTDLLPNLAYQVHANNANSYESSFSNFFLRVFNDAMQAESNTHLYEDIDKAVSERGEQLFNAYKEDLDRVMVGLPSQYGTAEERRELWLRSGNPNDCTRSNLEPRENYTWASDQVLEEASTSWSDRANFYEDFSTSETILETKKDDQSSDGDFNSSIRNMDNAIDDENLLTWNDCYDRNYDQSLSFGEEQVVFHTPPILYPEVPYDDKYWLPNTELNPVEGKEVHKMAYSYFEDPIRRMAAKKRRNGKSGEGKNSLRSKLLHLVFTCIGANLFVNGIRSLASFVHENMLSICMLLFFYMFMRKQM